MTVLRHYTLPNCSLMVEGLSSGEETDPMAPMTVLLNTEFTFPGMKETLSGGREFLEALAKAVGRYSQSILSGISDPTVEAVSETRPVVLQPSENHRHQLTAKVADSHGKDVDKTLTLSTVQIFDLQEAIDQLVADAQTLPDMTLHMAPLHRRHVRPAEPVSKQVVPVAAGVSMLAASAALLFMLPVPEVRIETEDQETTSQVESETDSGDTGASSPPDLEGPDVDADSDTTGTTSATSSDADADINADAEGADATVEAAPVVTQAEAAAALTRLSTAPEVIDPEAIARLETDLLAVLESELANPVQFEEVLIYRVAVSESGDLLGYKYDNDPAIESVNDTPLPELTFVPVDPEQVLEEPVAQFRVTFEPDGAIAVEPISDSE